MTDTFDIVIVDTRISRFISKNQSLDRHPPHVGHLAIKKVVRLGSSGSQTMYWNLKEGLENLRECVPYGNVKVTPKLRRFIRSRYVRLGYEKSEVWKLR